MKAIGLILLLFSFTSCSDDPAGDKLSDLDFGASYSLLQRGGQPLIENRLLQVRVGYSGCNGDHEFLLQSRIRQGHAELWLLKTTEDQLCEAYFEEVLSYSLSDEIMNSERIFIISPELERISLK